MYLRKCCNKKESGAITVFLALIFMSLIIFAGAVIDIVRIAAADRKVQSVLNSSARSVLASYDRELIGEYGIYGVNTADGAFEEDFYRYLSVNLQERHEGINFINITVDREDIEIQGMYSLLNEEAFKKQVQEYMKYRAPIIEAYNLVEQLKNIKLDKKVDFAKSEKATRDKARELRTKAKVVNARLEGIKKKMADLSADKLEELSKDLSEVMEISETISNSSGESLLDNYNDSKEAANIKAKDGECVENQSEEFGSIEENSEKLAPELQIYLKEINKTLAVVKPLLNNLEELKDELDDLEKELSDLKEEISELQESEGSSAESKEKTRDEIDEVEDDIDKVKDKIEELESRIEEEVSGLKAKLGRFFLNGYVLKDESVQLADNKAEELKESIYQIKENISKVLLRSLEKDWLISAEEFENGNLLISEDFAAMDENAHYNLSMQEIDAEKYNDKILEGMEKLSEAIEGAASGVAEKINTIEYVMDKYTFLTSKTERNHYFSKGEVEYIISGADTGDAYSRLKNTEYFTVANVLLQVWSLRFAIDAIDEFIRSALIFPPQRLAFALAEGALDSSLDMINMLNGEEVSLCPKSFTAVKLKYSDHLKILLLMKPEEEILRKAKQLMQVNIKQVVDAETGLPRSDFRLVDYSTVISARVEAKVNLFFLPLLKVNRLLPGSFEGGRYIISKQIYVGY
jgi:peptidoglycan hydrolase CwlO-like protein